MFKSQSPVRECETLIAVSVWTADVAVRSNRLAPGDFLDAPARRESELIRRGHGRAARAVDTRGPTAVRRHVEVDRVREIDRRCGLGGLERQGDLALDGEGLRGRGLIAVPRRVDGPHAQGMGGVGELRGRREGVGARLEAGGSELALERSRLGRRERELGSRILGLPGGAADDRGVGALGVDREGAGGGGLVDRVALARSHGEGVCALLQASVLLRRLTRPPPGSRRGCTGTSTRRRWRRSETSPSCSPTAPRARTRWRSRALARPSLRRSAPTL